MSEQFSDAELVARSQRGDEKAFELLVKRYQQRVTKLITRYVNDPSEAMDLTQETLIKAYRALPQFRGDSAFYTWLYRIAVNTVKNHGLYYGRRPPNVDIDINDAENFTSDRPCLKEESTPEHLLLRDEIEAAIFHAVDALPDELRSALILREMEGYSYEEIAELMGCPVGTVRSRIFRAREAVEKRIRPLLKG